MPKETGLMFKAPLVRAILSGQKTQTRRAFSGHMVKQMRAAAAIGEVSHFLDEGSLQPNDLAYVQQFSPVGQPGEDRATPISMEQLHGPVVDAEARADVVNGQQQVDDLLASLGF